jgi:hypothetical protein
MDATIVNHITLKAAMAGPYRDLSLAAVDKEIMNIIDTHDSITPIPWEHLKPEERGRARRNFIFLVHKYKADGTFDKVKARWVYGAANSGTIMDEEPRDTASPTVNPVTTLALLFMIAAYDMEMEVHDVPGAFLKSEMKADAQPLYGFVGPDVTVHIKRLYPLFASSITPLGNLFFRLKRYIYGTNEASKRFYDTMAVYLTGLGFVQSKCDPCLFIMYKDKDSVFAGIYVDDMLIAASNKKLMSWFSEYLKKDWETVFHAGDEFNYVGLHIVRASRTGRLGSI